MEYIVTENNTNKYFLKSGDTSEVLAYRCFVLLKTIDANGDASGKIEAKVAKKVIPLMFGKQITLAAIFRMPEVSCFMHFDDTKNVYLKSWDKIWETFGISPSGWVKIPYTAIKRKTSFLAHVYAAFVNNDHPISRDVIMDLVGITKPTQRKYERLAGITVTANYLELTAEEYDQGTHLPYDSNGEVVGVYQSSGKFYRQLPNSYVSKKYYYSKSSQISRYIQRHCKATDRRSQDVPSVVFITNSDIGNNGKVRHSLDTKGTSLTQIKQGLFAANNYGYKVA